MLGFNLISSQIIIGDVIDTEQFPEILHAWVRV
jgi:hypothetical protein